MSKNTKDITNITISNKSQNIIDTLKTKCYFSDDISVARFAVSYAISHNIFDPETIEDLELDEYRSNKWAQGSVDKDNYFTELISVFYPNINFPFVVIRNLIEVGLYAIDEKYIQKGDFKFSEII